MFKNSDLKSIQSAATKDINRKMPYFSNPLVQIPYNPSLLNESLSYGPGTARPISFNKKDMLDLYWNVRSFAVNIETIVAGDPLTAFLSSGGSSGTIIGSLTGLVGANEAVLGGSATLSGNTKPKQLHNIKQQFIQIHNNRIIKGGENGDKGGRVGGQYLITNNSIKGSSSLSCMASSRRNQEMFPVTEFVPNARERNTDNDTNRIMLGETNQIYEGNLAAPTPLHFLRSGQNRISIDFSNILFDRNLYWPIIEIQLSTSRGAVYSNQSGVATTSQTLGGVEFLGKQINFYTDAAVIANAINVVIGSISRGSGCCAKYYFDGRDKERIEALGAECAANCRDINREVAN